MACWRVGVGVASHAEVLGVLGFLDFSVLERVVLRISSCLMELAGCAKLSPAHKTIGTAGYAGLPWEACLAEMRQTLVQDGTQRGRGACCPHPSTPRPEYTTSGCQGIDPTHIPLRPAHHESVAQELLVQPADSFRPLRGMVWGCLATGQGRGCGSGARPGVGVPVSANTAVCGGISRLFRSESETESEGPGSLLMRERTIPKSRVVRWSRSLGTWSTACPGTMKRKP